MRKALLRQKVSIQVAAKILGVSRGTVIRYMDRDRLTRIRESSRVYVPMDEIRNLRASRKKSGGSGPGRTAHGDIKATVTLERDHYEELLTRLGQLESENQHLLEYKNDLVDIKTALVDREKDLGEVMAKLLMAEEELKKVRRMAWWQKLFGRR
ncbi:MAG: helix-turn-helix domain-containing protein [Deltaproteobacteria bacterium]|nr:MAG: helix-turn-helix domain-containing protein [Deltaproteobacteria bacterium]